MRPKMIALFLLLFYFANRDSVQDEVSCREIQGNEGCFLKFDKCSPGGQIIVLQDETTIGHADYSKNPPSFDIDKTFARSMNESGIFLNHCINGSIVYHNCNGIPEYSTDFCCTYGAPGASSQPNVTHPIANDTLKNGIILGVVAVVAGVIAVVVLCRKCMRKKEKKKMLSNPFREKETRRETMGTLCTSSKAAFVCRVVVEAAQARPSLGDSSVKLLKYADDTTLIDCVQTGGATGPLVWPKPPGVEPAQGRGDERGPGETLHHFHPSPLSS
ncbi:uncharacterized protein [Syngnathus scovelli]|uniref:uncharacterized protein isoform X2 n=1 Tax=Syngnathus scovelli TaxID=161590 RepID=UPI0021100EE2|nr:uncharacterized protein LOC125983894 isoform X2 [Syngnathus scovelli]